MYPLLLAIALIVYGSLYPWHFSAAHANPWVLLMHSWPHQWNGFDTLDAYINIGGYVPLGILAFLAAVRRRPPAIAAAAAILTGLLLSLSMELLQAFVPGRITSLVDIACNVTGSAVGVLAMCYVHKPGNRFRRKAVAPVLLLVCWAGVHFYPLYPSINFERVHFELRLWLHPRSVSPVWIWCYAAEWLAALLATQRLCGRVRLWWLLIPLAFHLAARPILISVPFGPEEGLGAALAALLWKTLPKPARSSPWLLISAVLLREWAPSQGIAAVSPFTVILLFGETFDYAGILWLSRGRGVSYGKGGALLAGALAVLVTIQRFLPRHALTMIDPALALLIALILRSCDSEI